MSRPCLDLDGELAKALRWAREAGDVELAREVLGELRARRQVRERDELAAEALERVTGCND